MTTVFLIRHGHTDWADKKLAGWLPDVHLNDAGRKQAEALVDRLAPIKFDALYSSPLERALETAVPLARARDLKIARLAGIGEVKYGDWQGKPLRQLSKKKEWLVVQTAPSLWRFPNGESMREMQSRAVAAVERLAADHPKGTLALYSHGDVIKSIVAHFIGMPLDIFQRLMIAPASITVLGLGRFGVRLLRLNDTGPFVAPPRNGHKK